MFSSLFSGLIFVLIGFLNNYYGQYNLSTLIGSTWIYIHLTQYKYILTKISSQHYMSLFDILLYDPCFVLSHFLPNLHSPRYFLHPPIKYFVQVLQYSVCQACEYSSNQLKSQLYNIHV